MSVLSMRFRFKKKLVSVAAATVVSDGREGTASLWRHEGRRSSFPARCHQRSQESGDEDASG